MTSTLNVYTTPPQKERKAVKEAREAGFKAYVPTEKKSYRVGNKTVRRRVPIAPGYVFAEAKPYEAKHIRARKGAVARNELARLYPRRDAGNALPDPFKPGDQVVIQRGPWTSLYGEIVEKRGKRGWWVDVKMFGTVTRTTLAAHYMRKHEPGTE